MNKYFLRGFFIIIISGFVMIGCSKSGTDPAPQPSPAPTPTPTPVPPATVSCVLSGISQVNSGTNAEFGLSVVYGNNSVVQKITVYDSLSNEKRFEASFNYITNDSIRIDSYQYLKLDASKRVVLLVTKSDMLHPASADDLRYEYLYNATGYLEKKNLFINGGKLANFSTTYSYTNNQLTSCVMNAVSSGNLKVLEATLVYDNSVTANNWIYNFPDGTESYIYSTVLNFGKHAANPLKQVVTKIFNPASGVVLDTWTTNYSDYKTDGKGNLTYGNAKGDLQQGIGSFYGKTNFYYNCK